MMAAMREIHVRGELRIDEPMERHTSWRVGGPADLFFVPASVDDLSAFLSQLDTRHADLLARRRQQPAGSRWWHSRCCGVRNQNAAQRRTAR